MGMSLRQGPAYGLIDPAAMTAPSRRAFLAGGGMLLGFVWAAGAKAQKRSQGEEPSLGALTPGEATGAAFHGFQPGGFIRIDPQGGVTLIIPSTEMGQGIYTGEAMLIAEELELGLDQVEIMPAPPNELLYAQPILKSQATGGSTSIRGAWGPLRQAGAAARTMLIAAAAQRWGVDPSDCFAERGVVYSRSTGRSAPYGALVDAAGGQQVPQNVALKNPRDWKLLGRPVPRLDTPSKVNGTAVYGIDVRIEGMKVAALAICPAQTGRLGTLDDRAARAMPGVIDVLRIDNAVAVVADNYWTAKKGVDALRIGWDYGKQARVSSEGVWKNLQDLSGNGTPVLGGATGDLDRGMNEARSKLDATYELPFLAHATMEPINTTVHVRPDAVEVWVGTQVPTAAQATAAKAAGVPPERVIINNHVMGGGFGRRLTTESVGQAVMFAKQVPYPLKVIWSREQDIQHDLYRPAYYDRISAGLDGDGLPIAWSHRTTGASVLGDYVPGGLPRGTIDSDAVEGAVELPYDIPHRRVDWVRADAPFKVNWWRGVGPTHNVFVVESFIDECAHSAGIDPVEYRRRLLRKNARSQRALELAAQRAGWGQPLPPRCGRGVSVHDSFGSRVALVVEAEVTPAGEVKLRKLTAAVDCGLVVNPNTVAAQIEGGVIFGLSAALYNGITVEGGVVQQSNFNDYRQMRINEVPPFDVQVIRSEADPGGIGECGTVSAAPALANAIFAATGVRLRRLPFRPELLAPKGGDKAVAALAPIGLGIAAAAALGSNISGEPA